MNEKARALMRVQEYGFALDEAILFLDTHTDDKDALEFYKKTLEEYNDAVAFYVKNYGPLNAKQMTAPDHWSWVEGCMPWESECNVEL